jgi:protein ImuB
MPLAAARRLGPEVRFLEPHPEVDRAAVEAVFERLAAFSPTLAGTTEPTDPSFGLVEIGIDGLADLWGEERTLARRVVSAVTPLLPVQPRVGIAGTRFAATMAAVRSRPTEPVIIPPGGEAAFLEPLPSTVLTTDPEIRERLLRFGLRRVGHVAALPRAALVARFGPEGHRLHARAVGEESEPIEPRRAPERSALGLSLEPAVDRLDALRFVLHRLVVGLVDHVAARGQAAATAELRLGLEARSSPSIMTVRQILPEPTADGEAIERLLFARLERQPPAAPVERLELELGGLVPNAGQQLELFGRRQADRRRLAWQLARFAIEFGADRIVEAEILDPEAWWAEARSRWRPWAVSPPSEGDAADRRASAPASVRASADLDTRRRGR